MIASSLPSLFQSKEAEYHRAKLPLFNTGHEQHYGVYWQQLKLDHAIRVTILSLRCLYKAEVGWDEMKQVQQMVNEKPGRLAM